ncbi:MAG TPA: hypothetical protein VJ739_07805 [Gemmataceae bacterium]|nr:hypothetical protein [Gemmataceae bacterium]
MPFPHRVAVPCKLAPGMFSSERLFTVELADGKFHRGIAPRYFCWNAQGQLVGESEPAAEADGMIAARVVRECAEYVAVEVPDGEVIAVKPDHVKDRPTTIRPPGHPGPAAPEPSPNVPI